MSWSSFRIKAVYDDGSNTPIENAFVDVRFKNSSNVFIIEYVSGYTDSNGIFTVNSTQNTNNLTTTVYRVIDESKTLQEGDITSTIVNNSQYMVYFNLDGAGIEFNARLRLVDGLCGKISSHYITKLLSPKRIELYTKNLDNTYNLYNTYYTNEINIFDNFHTLELRCLVYRENNDVEYGASIGYKDAMFMYESWPFLTDDYYDFKLPLVNDTIDWNTYNTTLKNVNFDITLRGHFPNIDVPYSAMSNSEFWHVDIYDYFHGYGAGSFNNLIDPSLNTIKASKNHYNDLEYNMSISAETVNGDFSNYIIILSGSPNIILEREPNVCMTNEDLYDYVESLTGIRPDISKFSDYETDVDLMKKVGVSKLPFYNDWISAITQYLPQQYQGQTASTLNDFKMLFVSAISTDYVQTMYTSSPLAESQYGANSNHGYVWDRCFIPEEKEFVENCLTFSTLPNNTCDISFNYMPGPRTLFDFEYSLDGGDTWNAYSFGQNGIGQVITLSPGGNTSVKFRRELSNTGTTLSTSEDYFYYFSMTGTCSSTGCVNSLLDGYGLSTTELTSKCCFSKLFINCAGLRSAPELPATTLASCCYENMFAGCTSLTTAPELPATTLADNCYFGMFQGCTSLTTAPELPATALCQTCYCYMFLGCTSLTTAPELPATALADNCYFGMFSGCSSLINVQSALPATTLYKSCYNKMFAWCTSLTAAPELPATTLDNNCYNAMFAGCTALTNVQSALPATTLAYGCYKVMFSKCAITTPPILSARTLAEECCFQMFALCESLTETPLLRATTLADNCYNGMFLGCTSLTNAKTLSAATVLSEGCFEDMFYRCTSLSTAPTISRSPGMQKNCFKKMFYGCSSLETMPYTGSSFPWQSHAYGCYESMFEGCTSLRNVPSTIFGYNARDYCFKRMFAGCSSILNPITIYANNLGSLSGVCESMFENCISLMSGRTANSLVIGPDCYKNMFKNCGKLMCIEAKFTGTTSGSFTIQNSSAYTYNWVYGVANVGTFYHKSETPGAPFGYSTNWIPNGWTASLLA